MIGYDPDLLERVAFAVRVPVIAPGGVGCFEDMPRAVVEAGSPAFAEASMFHFTDQTPMEAKRYLAMADVPVRMGRFGEAERLMRRP